MQGIIMRNAASLSVLNYPASTPATVSQLFAGRRAAMVVYSPYPADPRPRRAIDALLEEGMTIDLVCEGGNGAPGFEDRGALTITRIPIPRRRLGPLTYAYQYGMFIAISGALLAWRSVAHPYDLVYVHNMPDVLVASAMVPRLRGAKIILDQHDPMPELMMTIFGAEKDSMRVRFLESMERWSLGAADQVVTVNEACRKIFARRGCLKRKISVVMNAPDERYFAYQPASSCRRWNATEPFILMYHGGLVERNGLELVVEAMSKMALPPAGVELRIYGNPSPYLERVLARAEELGIRDSLRYLGPKTVEELVKEIDRAHVGVIPNLRNPFTEINTPVRIFEYLSRGKPVIAPRTPGILDYFNDDALMFFEPGNSEDLASKLTYACLSPAESIQMAGRGQAVYRDHTWQKQRQELLRVVSDCLQGRQA